MNETTIQDITTSDHPEMTVCARYDVLRALAHASGVEQITLIALPNKRYQVSFGSGTKRRNGISPPCGIKRRRVPS